MYVDVRRSRALPPSTPHEKPARADCMHCAVPQDTPNPRAPERNAEVRQGACDTPGGAHSEVEVQRDEKIEWEQGSEER